jgi:hypothetical protein
MGLDNVGAPCLAEHASGQLTSERDYEAYVFAACSWRHYDCGVRGRDVRLSARSGRRVVHRDGGGAHRDDHDERNNQLAGGHGATVLPSLRKVTVAIGIGCRVWELGQVQSLMHTTNPGDPQRMVTGGTSLG